MPREGRANRTSAVSATRRTRHGRSLPFDPTLPSQTKAVPNRFEIDSDLYGNPQMLGELIDRGATWHVYDVDIERAKRPKSEGGTYEPPTVPPPAGPASEYPYGGFGKTYADLFSECSDCANDRQLEAVEVWARVGEGIPTCPYTGSILALQYPDVSRELHQRDPHRWRKHQGGPPARQTVKGMIRLAFPRMLLKFRSRYCPQDDWTYEEVLAEFDRRYGELGKNVPHKNQYRKN